MPSKAIELTAFDAYKKLLSHEDEEGKLKRPGPLLTGLAGAAAGTYGFNLCSSVIEARFRLSALALTHVADLSATF